MIKVGKNLGNFLVKSEIGKGGMGTIYFAVDTMLNREVALKVIHPELTSNTQLMERFKIEAMTQAQMNHPNVVIVFSFNKIEGEFFIAMEYVDGKSLKEILNERGVLSIKEAIHYFKQILSGLDYAHSNNIIHRDIKPANIMVTNENKIKISDFGIAKVFGREGLTKTGMLIGTPWYTSPEQILGKNIDFRSDLYSAGITFYEMLTGRVPFDSETNSEFQIQRAHLETPPTRPSIYNSEIGTTIEKFILKTLQKNPEKRSQNATEMLDEIEKIEKTISETTILQGEGSKTEFEKSRLLGKKKFLSPLKIVSFFFFILIAVASFIFINKTSNSKKNERKIIEELEKKEKVIPEKKAISDVTKSSDKTNSDKIIQKKAAEPIKNESEQDIPIKTEKKKTEITDSSSKNKVVKKESVKTQKEKTLTKESTQPVMQDQNEKLKSKDIPIVQEKPKKIEKPAINIEAELFKIRSLIKAKSYKKAEKMGDKLLEQSDSAMVLSAIGSIKFFMSKFYECEKYWKNAIEKNGSIKINFFHKHGIFSKGCSGQIVFNKGMIMYDSLTRPDHSFALTKDKINSIIKPTRTFGIEIKFLDKGKKRKETFILYLKHNRRKKEKFIVDFINKYILEVQ